jgi:hypothetical protein
MTNPRKYRVAPCPHTGHEVVQLYIKNDAEEWLCLHRDTPEEDAHQVEFFKEVRASWEAHKNG